MFKYNKLNYRTNEMKQLEKNNDFSKGFLILLFKINTKCFYSLKVNSILSPQDNFNGIRN